MSHWINRIALITAVVFGLSACVEERVVVKVKKDGSGIVEHHSYNNMDDMMSGFLSGMVEQEGLEEVKGQMEADTKKQFDQQYFENFAREMGEGVSVKDYTLGSNAVGMQGYHAVYQFEDINKLAVKMRENFGEDEEQLADQKDALTQKPDFSMHDGVLKITIPHQFEPPSDQPVAEDDLNNMPPQMLGMMAAMFQGMRIAISIEGMDTIKETNARHHDGNKIVLTDIRMDELMGNMDSMQKMQKMGSLPRAEMQAMADTTEGLDIDLQDQIVIRF